MGESECSDDEDKEEAAMDVESSTQAKAEEVENQLKLDPTKNVQIANSSSEEETSKDATDAKVESPPHHHQANCANVNANVRPGAGADPTKPKARKKKELRKKKPWPSLEPLARLMMNLARKRL